MHASDLSLVIAPRVFLYNLAEDGMVRGCQTDEVFSGWAVRVLETKEHLSHVLTHYGYGGWMDSGSLRPVSPEALQAREGAGRFPQVRESWLDLHAEPRVQGLLLATLPRGAIVERLDAYAENGWERIRAADGTEGWVRSDSLRLRADSDAFLLQPDPDLSWFRGHAAAPADESALREAVCRSALSWLGTPYRWGGKSPMGIDCSGLAFMAWMENGVLIYRDADIRPDYPVREISRDRLRMGDLIFFPGHVAVYLGEGRYVHATAAAKTPRVVVNSLNPGDPDYREDLARAVTACGSMAFI